MSKTTRTAVLLALASLALIVMPAGPGQGAGKDKKLQVVASLPDLAAIARAVGGDRIDVTSIALGIQDPHYLEAKPSYQLQLSRADLVIYNGLELEIGWLPLLVQGSRNPKIAAGSKGTLNASNALTKVLEVPAGGPDRSMGDVHPQGNPHYLTDPRNGAPIAALVRDKLKELDLDGASVYDSNYTAFAATMAKKLAEWEQKAQGLRGKKVVEYHKQWLYFGDWLGLDIVDDVEDRPGIPTTPQHRAELVNHMKNDGVKILIRANYNPGLAVCQEVASETGATVVSLPASVGGEPGIDEYPQLFDKIIAELVGAAGSAP
jgi:zinc/manganese transport system substrate-binding protein